MGYERSTPRSGEGSGTPAKMSTVKNEEQSFAMPTIGGPAAGGNRIQHTRTGSFESHTMLRFEKVEINS